MTNDERKTIQKIVKYHSGRTFSYLAKEDLEQEIWIICLQALDDFDKERGFPLEHFLRSTVRNRMTNRFRFFTKHIRSPCPRCVNPVCGPNPESCKKWTNYLASVRSKDSLLKVIKGSNANELHNTVIDNPLDKMIGKEAKELISQHLDKDHKYDFQVLLTNGHLTKHRKKILIDNIRRILEDHGYIDEKE